MKKLAAIVVILLCLYICACGNAEAPPGPADANVLPEYAYPFCYASLCDFKKSISKEKELYAELSEKGAKKETIDDFGVFVEKYKSQNFIVPYINGKAIELCNKEGYAGISVFPSDTPVIFPSSETVATDVSALTYDSAYSVSDGSVFTLSFSQ